MMYSIHKYNQKIKLKLFNLINLHNPNRNYLNPISLILFHKVSGIFIFINKEFNLINFCNPNPKYPIFLT